MTRADIRNVLNALGGPKLPKKVWQEPFDWDPGHFERLCTLAGDMPEAGDLVAYAHDIGYGEDVQPDLFHYLLPICLRAWQQDLMRDHLSPYAGFVEYFSAALARRPLIADLLKAPAAEAVMAFMRDSILDRIDRETSLSHKGLRGSPYPWFEAIGSFAVLFPNLDSLWRTWWPMETPGHAIGVLQYMSCLMYADDQNPIFAPWTPKEGGGPPALWETDSHIYEQCWQPANVAFFRTTMTPYYVREALDRALVVLQGHMENEVPTRMCSDFERQRNLLTCRLAALPEIVSEPLMNADWPDRAEGHRS